MNTCPGNIFDGYSMLTTILSDVVSMLLRRENIQIIYETSVRIYQIITKIICIFYCEICFIILIFL